MILKACSSNDIMCWADIASTAWEPDDDASCTYSGNNSEGIDIQLQGYRAVYL